MEKTICKNILTLCVLYVCCAAISFAGEKKNESPQFTGPKASLHIELFDENPDTNEIFKNFNIVLAMKNKTIQPETVLTCKNGMLIDKSGKTVFKLSEHSPVFYGYEIQAVLWDKKAGVPDSIVLIPHFGDGKNVGDSLTLLWNDKQKTFYFFVPPDVPDTAAPEKEEKTVETINLPRDIFAGNIFDGIPASPELITEEHETKKLGRDEAMENYWRLAGEWEYVIICSSDRFKFVYTQHNDEYTVQSAELKGKTPCAAEWSSYIGQNTDYLLRVFGVPKRLNSSAVLYASNEYYVHFSCDKKIISAVLLAREQ